MAPTFFSACRAFAVLCLAFATAHLRGQFLYVGNDNPSHAGATPQTITGTVLAYGVIVSDTTVTAELTVHNGGNLTGYQGVIVGNSLAGSGHLTVSGTGSMLGAGLQPVSVGHSGNGSMIVQGGAAVSSHGGILGWGPKSNGSATISGIGSSWDFENSTGPSHGGSMIMGDLYGSVGSLALSDGALARGGGVLAGQNGSASISVQSGSVLSTKGATLALAPGGKAQVSIDGLGSEWTTNKGQLMVGQNGRATVTISNGALLSTGLTYIGVADPFGMSRSSVSVIGPGSQWTTNGDKIEVGGYSGVPGHGDLLVSQGGAISASLTTVNYGSTVFVGAGSTLASTVVVNATSLLGGSGTIGSLTLNKGALLSPGESPGKLTVNGAATLAGGAVYNFEINDATGLAGVNWDLLGVSGAIALASTTENPLLLKLFSLGAGNIAGLAAHSDPSQNYRWTFLEGESLGGYSEGNVLVDASGFMNALAGGFSIAQTGNSLDLLYSTSRFPAHVPDHGSTAALCGAAILGAALWKRKHVGAAP